MSKLIIMPGWRLGPQEINTYVTEKCKYSFFDTISEQRISGIQPLLQENYGGDNDCTLTSITTILSWVTNQDPQSIYDTVEQIAKKYFYNAKTTGTIPLFIKGIMNKLAIKYNISAKCLSKYFKDVQFNYAGIKNKINKNVPVILNINNDGRNCYKNHSVLIVGYKEVMCGSQTVRLLLVYDNWYDDISYIDYDMLKICSVNYYKEII